MHRFKNELLVILLLVLLGSAILFRSFVFNNLILPIVVLFWAAWRVVLAVDQTTYWLILIVVCLLLMARFVRLPRKQAVRPAYGYQLRPVSRVDHWRDLIEASSREENGESKLHDSLKNLALSAMDTSSRSDFPDAKDRKILEQSNLPPEVRQYLFPSGLEQKGITVKRTLPPLRVAWLQKLQHRFKPPDKPPVEQVIRWIENYLEITHD